MNERYAKDFEIIEKKNLTIGIDLDGTICAESKGEDFLQVRLDAIPLPGAKEALDKLRNKGYYIVIYTGRNISWHEKTEQWLCKNKIYFDKLICEKLPLNLYIGNEAIHFDGNWKKTMEKVERRK